MPVLSFEFVGGICLFEVDATTRFSHIVYATPHQKDNILTCASSNGLAIEDREPCCEARTSGL